MVSEVRYSAFGGIRYQSGTSPTDYLYTGQRQEAEIGLYHYGARWYDPAIGRFIQADSIVPNPMSAKGFDRYAYVSNNPMKYVDPSGHSQILLDNEQLASNNGVASNYSSTVSNYSQTYVPQGSLTPSGNRHNGNNNSPSNSTPLIDGGIQQQPPTQSSVSSPALGSAAPTQEANPISSGPTCPIVEMEHYYEGFSIGNSDIDSYYGMNLDYKIHSLQIETKENCPYYNSTCYFVKIMDYHKLWIGGENSGTVYISIAAKTANGNEASVTVEALDVGNAANEGDATYGAMFIVPNQDMPIVEMYIWFDFHIDGAQSTLFKNPKEQIYDIPLNIK